MKEKPHACACQYTWGGNAPVELRDVAEPEAAANEAIIEVRAFSLNRGELSQLANRPEGWRPGQDMAGVIVQAAADGSGPQVGSRVVALVDQAGWAQQAAALTARMAVLPEKVSFAQAATLPIAGLAALRILRLSLYPLGSRILITGASGGVVGRAERAAGLRELGAASVVTSIQEAQGPYHLILESVGGASLAQAIHLVAPNGTIVLSGNSSGEQTPISFPAFAGHAGARLTGFFLFLSGDPASFGADLALLVSLIAAGKLTPQIGLEESWHNLARVLPALRERRVNGKAIFRVD